jgi:hypothetical protein
MSKKHFIFAANQIIDWCKLNGTKDYTECPYYDFALNFFSQFSANLDDNTLSLFIEKGLI